VSTEPVGYQNPKTNWGAPDAPGPADFIRIEGNIQAIESGVRTVDPALAGAANQGTIRQFLSWIVGKLAAIIGAEWFSAPPTTLVEAKAHHDAEAPHTGHETPAGAQAKVDAHKNQAVDAHDAAAISYAGGTGISATNVEAAIDELATEKSNVGHGHAATEISYAGSANLSSTNVEAALDELDAEKASKALANSWTARQTFQGGIQDGDGNQDVSLLHALGLQIDTRTLELTRTGGVLTSVVEKDGAATVKTVTLNRTGGVLTGVVTVAGGKTITQTLNRTGGVLTSVTKTVV